MDHIYKEKIYNLLYSFIPENIELGLTLAQGQQEKLILEHWQKIEQALTDWMLLDNKINRLQCLKYLSNAFLRLSGGKIPESLFILSPFIKKLILKSNTLDRNDLYYYLEKIPHLLSLEYDKGICDFYFDAREYPVLPMLKSLSLSCYQLLSVYDLAEITPQLESLFLFGHQIEIESPCPKLKNLSLGTHKIQYFFDDAQLFPQLESLSFVGNGYTGDFPASFATLKHLRSLEINGSYHFNRLETLLPLAKQLRFLGLQRCAAIGNFEALAAFTALEVLDLTDTLHKYCHRAEDKLERLKTILPNTKILCKI